MFTTCLTLSDSRLKIAFVGCDMRLKRSALGAAERPRHPSLFELRGADETQLRLVHFMRLGVGAVSLEPVPREAHRPTELNT